MGKSKWVLSIESLKLAARSLVTRPPAVATRSWRSTLMILSSLPPVEAHSQRVAREASRTPRLLTSSPASSRPSSTAPRSTPPSSRIYASVPFWLPAVAPPRCALPVWLLASPSPSPFDPSTDSAPLVCKPPSMWPTRKTGMIDIGIGAGVESMSLQYGPGAVTEFSELLESHPEAANCKVPMGVLSEQMAKDLGITRAAQDAFAANSYQKAVKAQKAGLFDEEIASLKVKVEDKEGNIKEITVSRDDGVRDGITAESLGKIGQKILGKYVCASVVGVKPLLMGQGPWKAIPKALEQAGISKDDVDIWEINEAFASQCLWCANELGIPQEKINPKGGAIAFGHPLGCTGARQVSTLLYELKRTGQRVGATSMCVGTGMGMAAIWVAE